jgi:hypothetical protein
MSVKEQLINDIKLLPDHTLQAISVIVKEFVLLNSELSPRQMSREEVCGCMRGQFKMPEDFNEPIEDFKEYME